MAAQKQISLWKLPRILVFHIKRFQYKASQYFAHSVRRDKINKYVDYDTNGLDMGPYCLDPKIACEGKEPIYDLIGVVNHMGSMVSPSFRIRFSTKFYGSKNFSS